MKKIIIALNYDPTAEIVAKEGYALARTMNAEVLLVHVMADTSSYLPFDFSPVMGFSGVPPAEILESSDMQRIRDAAQQYLNSSKEHLRDAAIKTKVLEGDFAGSILKAAHDYHADMIVLGTHSRSAWQEILMGSVTKKLIHDSNIPLYIIPTKSVKK